MKTKREMKIQNKWQEVEIKYDESFQVENIKVENKYIKISNRQIVGEYLEDMMIKLYEYLNSSPQIIK